LTDREVAFAVSDGGEPVAGYVVKENEMLANGDGS
jgi:hypothetical protein